MTNEHVVTHHGRHELRPADDLRDRRNLPADRCDPREPVPDRAREPAVRLLASTDVRVAQLRHGMGAGEVRVELPDELHRRSGDGAGIGGAIRGRRIRIRDDAVRGSQIVFWLFILGLIIPTEATIVPLYYDVRAMG